MAAQRGVQVISRATPLNLQEELAELECAYRAGHERSPQFRYGAAALGECSRDLQSLADDLDALDEPLASIYAARARELGLEAELCESAGRSRLWALARRRYRLRDAHDRAADALADRWVEGPIAADHGASPCALLADDDRDPRSLLSRIRSEIGARRLGLRVVVTDRLSALAATGQGVILVAAGRAVTPRDVERTVLHEIDGHAVPRQRAQAMPLAIFRIGTAFGSDDQEGRALSIEERGGWLDAARRRELGLRHIACRAVEARADFVATVRLLGDLGAPLADRVRIAARAHRGGGLGREAVYLPSYLRVSAALAASPELDAALGAGRVAVDCARALREWAAFAAERGSS